MAPRSLSTALQRLLVGPRQTALRVGVPSTIAVAVVTALSTALILESSTGGGVYFPVDAVLVAVAASTLYAARYRAFVVCTAIGVAALAGSTVGFHALHGDEALLGVLARLLREGEAMAIGAVFGAFGAVVGGVLGYAYRAWRQRVA
jgi:hypothetical protein